MRDVVAELIFLLIARDRKRGDDGRELVVSKGFETGRGVKICAERKSKSEAETGVAVLDVMEIAGFKRKRAGPCWREAELLGEEKVVVIRSGAGTGGGESGLLDEIVLSAIAIEGETEKPLGICGLGPIEARSEKMVAKRNRDAGRDRDGLDSGDEATGGQLSQSVELRLGVRTVGYAGVFVDILVARKKP